ncbi:YceI family protein [Acidimicrobiia bacterium]|jgi:polyisoprenoid-binding protein YceI|nr:YceI family protein [Acidimicrobiia bacterium]MDA7721343.1 YceI family protein [Acidimicrobiaceae bacterium]MDA8813417.1 YceI family protein [Candidatus Actinomarina sp.]MDA7850548.1 YceI family protein [Acidimicrobiaceae bacterium]MDA8922537.1 YceI family protein [Acidimicrobiia bacterium]
MKKLIILILFFSFCSSQDTVSDEETSVKTTILEIQETEDTSTTTSIEVTQLESFDGAIYTVNKELSTVSYLAPKQFLNANLEIVEGITNEVSGDFELTLGECDLADSCLQVRNLSITADLSTLKSSSSIRDGAIKTKWLESKIFPNAVYSIDEIVLPNNNFDSKIDETIVGVLSIRNIEINVPFSITAFMEDDKIYVSGVTEIDTTWFGFDAPTKFNAWEVLNPIGIKISIVAEK